MSIYQKSKDDLALAISASMGKVIIASHFNILGIRPTPAGQSERNTKIAIEMSTTSAYTGRKIFYYDRLDLANFAKLRSFPPGGQSRLRVGRDLNAHDILDTIRDALGVNFNVLDIENNTTIAYPGGTSLLLKAKPESLGWVGEYTLKFKDIPDISEAFYQTSLPGV